MKKFAGLILALAIVVLGAFYGMGYKTEESFKATMVYFNQMQGISAQIEEYDRGWFSSNVIVNWVLTVPERVEKNDKGQTITLPAKSFHFKMPLLIHHGPIIVADSGMYFGLGYASSTLSLPDELKTQAKAIFSDKSDEPKLQLSLFINYFNKVWFSMGIPKFTLLSKDGDGKFQWYGMKSSAAIASGHDSFEGKVNIKGFVLSKKGAQVEMGRFDSLYNLHRAENGLMLGNVSLKFPKILVKEADKRLFELDGLAVSSDSGIDHSLLHSSSEIALDKFFINGDTYGPGQLTIAVRNLDANAVAKIHDQVASMKEASDLQRQQTVLMILPELPSLFNKGAELEIPKLKLQLPQGTIEGHLLIQAPDTKGKDPLTLLKELKGNGRLQMPIQLVKTIIMQSIKQQMSKTTDMQNAIAEQMRTAQQQNAAVPQDSDNAKSGGIDQASAEKAQQLLDSLSSSHVLMTKGSDYVLEFKLEQGQLTVNGKPVKLPMLP